MMQVRNFVDEMHAELDKIGSPHDFCRDWQPKWRHVAVSAQGMLQVLCPPAAKVVGFLILVADNVCVSGEASACGVPTPPSAS